jgi:hypothetical protein
MLAASSPDLTDQDAGQIHQLLQNSLDWEYFLRLVEQHGTSSLVHQTLERSGDAIPPAVLESLKQRHERNIHKSLFLTRELFRILDRLDTLRLDAFPYKGIVLSEIYYGDMAMRQSGDMDILVRKTDVTRIKQAVRDLGYTPRLLIPADAEADYLNSGYECTFDSSAGKNLLELQWALQPSFYAVDFDMDGLFNRAVSVEITGRCVRTPSPDDLVLVLSMHAAKHVWGRLIWLCDIAQMVKRGDVNWERAQTQAHELGIERILHITLSLANRLLATPIPEPLAARITKNKSARDFANQIAISIAAGVIYEDEKLSYFRLMMDLRERRMDRLRFLARLAFTPGPGEWERVRLPKFLFPLYRLVRMGRLASRLSR